MAIDILGIIFGIFALYYGGDFMVNGATALSLRLGISPMIVGLTVISFATSAPELFVAIGAALQGHGDISYGNSIGSNIANILLILAVPAIITPLRTDKYDSRIPWAQTLFACLLFWVLAQFSPFGRWQGSVLLVVFALIIFWQIRTANTTKAPPRKMNPELKNASNRQIALWLIIGIIALPVGAQSLVNGAVDIAKAFGLSDAFIGLTIVAIGTSLPELAAGVSSATKGETDMAIGSVFGSSLFNILLILGLTGVVEPVTIDPKLIHYDALVMIAAVAAMGYFVIGRKPIRRPAGLLMIGCYILYLITLA